MSKLISLGRGWISRQRRARTRKRAVLDGVAATIVVCVTAALTSTVPWSGYFVAGLVYVVFAAVLFRTDDAKRTTAPATQNEE